MTDNEKNDQKALVKSLIDSVGAIAEMTMMFYNAALKHSENPGDAMIVTRVFLDSLIQCSGGKNTNE